MGDLKQKFIELAKQLEALNDQRDALREELTQTMLALGLGTLAQDSVTGIVYKVNKPKGTFTYFRDIDYVRTAKPDERAGSLSKKEAEEAGFNLKK